MKDFTAVGVVDATSDAVAVGTRAVHDDHLTDGRVHEVLLHLGLPATVIAVPTQVHARLGEREESAAIPLREVLGRCSISRRRRPRLLFVRIFGGFSDFSSPPLA